MKPKRPTSARRTTAPCSATGSGLGSLRSKAERHSNRKVFAFANCAGASGWPAARGRLRRRATASGAWWRGKEAAWRLCCELLLRWHGPTSGEPQATRLVQCKRGSTSWVLSQYIVAMAAFSV